MFKHEAFRYALKSNAAHEKFDIDYTVNSFLLFVQKG